jgi:hypothetical protein
MNACVSYYCGVNHFVEIFIRIIYYRARDLFACEKITLLRLWATNRSIGNKFSPDFLKLIHNIQGVCMILFLIFQNL